MRRNIQRVSFSYETGTETNRPHSALLGQGRSSKAGRVLALDGGEAGARVRSILPAGQTTGGTPLLVGVGKRNHDSCRNARHAFMRHPGVRESGTPQRRDAGRQPSGQDGEGAKPWQPHQAWRPPAEMVAGGGRGNASAGDGVSRNRQRSRDQRVNSTPDVATHGLIDERNRDMYPARLDECRKALFGTTPELPGQLDMFAEGVA